MEQNIQNLIDLITANEQISVAEKAAFLNKLKEIDKKITVTEFKLDRTEKVKRTTAILLEETIEELENKRKAVEAQKKELEIEAALERVRARTMAMQKSEDMNLTASEMFKQIQTLEIQPWACGFNIFDKDEKAVTQYMSLADGGISPPFRTPLTEDPFFIKIYDARQRKDELLVWESKGESLAETYRYMFSLPGSKEIFGDLENSGFEMPKFQITHCAYFSQGYLVFITYEPVPHAHDIFRRFAKVFEQTYTRFLDLQKAEAQAREAQIEAALEKIRGRSLAMHHSNELKDIIAIMFEKASELNVLIGTVAIWLFNKETKDSIFWVGNNLQQPSLVNLPYEEQLMKEDSNYRDSWMAFTNGESYINRKYNKAQKDKHFEYVFANNSLVSIPPEVREFITKAESYNASLIVEKNSSLYFDSWNGELYSKESVQVLGRITKVFEQAYVRFLDLQKAEAQAREAQIQLALERVRARTMAMQKQKDLFDVANAFGGQLVALGLRVDYISFMYGPISKKRDWNLWGCVPDLENSAQNNIIPYKETAYFIKTEESVDRYENTGNPIQVKTFTKEEKNEFLDHYFFVAQPLPDEFKKLVYDAPGSCIVDAFLNEVTVSICRYDAQEHYTEEQLDIFKRFSQEFRQAYIRFLDLQKAELQVREAQIEAALEKVRSRSLAMHKSDEIKSVVAMVVEKIAELNIEMNGGVSLATFIPGSKDLLHWFLNPEHFEEPLTMHLPYFSNLIYDDCMDARAKGNELFSNVYNLKDKNEYFSYAFKHSEFKNVPEELKQWILEQPYFGFSFAIQKNSGIFLNDYTGKYFSKETNDILVRFSRVFEQAYVRFLDLQKAEAQALEAIKRASVDRVRAEIASMRTTKDLERITPLIWNELTTLGVPFIRCGVFIMDEEKQLIETHLSTPAGEAIATFSLPFNAPGEASQILAHWHKKELYKQHWNEEQFVEFTQNLLQQGAVTSGEKYLTENRPTDLYLHFLPFTQGMLYVGNTAPLIDDELQLMQSLADAFATAYARYEDFNKLESAKKQVESTLSALQATQKQLIQSEKMASLGELTAGIAHEIQNPLNFVNNFSEINKEMIDEATEEIEKGNIDEAKIILNDVKENEQKINHHGKRADAIVKGMLQHSRTSSGQKEATDINALCDEYLRLAYHGLRAKDKSFNADFKTAFDESIGKLNVIPQDIGRVLLNLINNAFYATNEKKKTAGSTYQPTVFVKTNKINNGIEINVSDNGNGISQNIIEKIFQPFFTTKPTGQGTGLGLSLSYDIIKAHGGEIKVETKEGEGSEFIVLLPA